MSHKSPSSLETSNAPAKSSAIAISYLKMSIASRRWMTVSIRWRRSGTLTFRWRTKWAIWSHRQSIAIVS